MQRGIWQTMAEQVLDSKSSNACYPSTPPRVSVIFLNFLARCRPCARPKSAPSQISNRASNLSARSSQPTTNRQPIIQSTQPGLSGTQTTHICNRSKRPPWPQSRPRRPRELHLSLLTSIADPAAAFPAHRPLPPLLLLLPPPLPPPRRLVISPSSGKFRTCRRRMPRVSVGPHPSRISPLPLPAQTPLPLLSPQVPPRILPSSLAVPSVCFELHLLQSSLMR